MSADDRTLAAPLLSVVELRKHFGGRNSMFGKKMPIRAVDGVSLEVAEGEVVGIVGESGCGKSTLGDAILRLVEPTSGQVRFRGESVLDMNRGELRRFRRDAQIILQDPYTSLNSRMTVYQIVSEPWHIFKDIEPKGNWGKRVDELLSLVGLGSRDASRYPHQFSGGQRQRISIARALAVKPKLLICDEPVSALDVSVQAQIINLLMDLRQEFNLSYLFISHDLSVVRQVADRVLVMYLGKVMEYGSNEDVFSLPEHPYTEALMGAVPTLDGKPSRVIAEGDVPNPYNPPEGCLFCTRCPWVEDRCRVEEPVLEKRNSQHPMSCHFSRSERNQTRPDLVDR